MKTTTSTRPMLALLAAAALFAGGCSSLQKGYCTSIHPYVGNMCASPVPTDLTFEKAVK